MRTNDPDGLLADAGLDGQLSRSGLVRAAHREMLETLKTSLASGNADIDKLDSILRFTMVERELRFAVDRNLIARSLLLPYADFRPHPYFQRRIIDYFTREASKDFGDPRIKPEHWATIDPAAASVLRRWFVEETLDDFFRLFDQTSNQYQWRYRWAFWDAYLSKNLISDAWVVLGPTARKLVKKGRLKHLEKYGKLLGAQSGQSALLMKIDHLIIAEWSENGRCRIWRDSDDHAPELHKKEYTSTQLRAPTNGVYPHVYSEKGVWQGQISNHIRRFTGITLWPHEYMPDV